ncbi:hypothetical protein QFZ53_000405 [Microbacterium natoriense]|uniref:Rhamnogalacturonase A/B/Epimerase-like pectate lyase domain-containing protein n=1 Tax=Microbacterium natoriense TaxID=284570 RepID=A0AAW8ETM1_9MICO|nr:glycosyl hydrolase family 28-related protein [Microbacterium natoriense]MDQ0646209.1 hypothetical protein [Microbacterium natoriense]
MFDVRDYGAIGDGVADDSAAFVAALAAGDAYMPEGTYRLGSTVAIPAGRQLMGSGAKTTTILVTTDITALTWAGGQAESLRNFRLRSWYVGNRTAWDIDVTNPVKTVFEDIEIDGATGMTGNCGIRMRGDNSRPGEAHFMPQLSRVWIRNGRLVVNQVSDGHVSDSFIWSNNNTDVAAVDFSNIADGWSFSNVDTVPGTGDGSSYSFTNVHNIVINGGYSDGSYVDIMTGYGIKAVNSGQLFVAGWRTYNLGKSGIHLTNTHNCSFSAVGFQQGNKADGGYPDIELVASTGNTFLGTEHSQPAAHAAKGQIYREDAASTHNSFDYAAIVTVSGNQYATPYFQGNATTIGASCRPRSLWTRHASAPNFQVPPASLLTIPSPSPWPAANTVIAHRMHIQVGAVYSLAQFRVDSGSGNMQIALLKIGAGGAWTRPLNSGTVACTTGDKSQSMTAAYLDPGEYALALWCDNATAVLRYATNSGLVATRLTSEWVSAEGISASGVLTWGSPKYVGGLVLAN